MRSLLPLLLLALTAAAPAASQAVLVPLRCTGDCPAPDRLPRALASDTTSLRAVLSRGNAQSAVHLAFRNDTDGVIDGALFLPLPADAIVTSVVVNPLGGQVSQYGDWSRDEESRWVFEGVLRDRPSPALRAYRGARVLHAPILDIPARRVMLVTVSYTQALRETGGRVAYAYPLSVGGDAPTGPFKATVTVETEAGFRALSSPSHELDVRWGLELVRCPCGSRCGTTGAESHRIKHVRASGDGRDGHRKAFKLVYTMIPPGSPDAVSPPPDPVC